MSSKLSPEQRAAIGRNVQGHPTAFHYVPPHYYDAEGTYLFSNDDASPPPGAKSRQAVGGVPPAPPAPEVPEDPRKVLEAKPVSQLQKMQRMLDVPEEQIIKGEGAKAKLVDWLLANTQQ